MSQREGDPKNRPAPTLPSGFEPAEDDPTNLIPSESIPSGRSLGEDPTALAAGTLSGLRIDSSDTALLFNPEPSLDPSGIEHSASGLVIDSEPSRIDHNATALLILPPVSAEISHTDDMPVQQRQALSEAEQRMAKRDVSLTADLSDDRRRALSAAERKAHLEGPATLLLGTPAPRLDRDATAIRTTPLLANEVTGVMVAPGHNEPSLGAKVTQANEVPGEATEMRQVFAAFSSSDERGRRRRNENSRPGSESSSVVSSPKLWIAVLSSLLLAIGGFFLHNYYSQRRRVEALGDGSRSAVAQAQQHGRLLDFLAADTQLRALLVEQPTDGVALSARALMLAEALYEFGGNPDFAVDVQSAVRQSEGENRPAAVAAQLFLSLFRAELKSAESALARLNALPASADTAQELAPLPLGLRDYLSSQVLLVSGHDGEAIEALRDAVAKNKLPLWQRRLGYVLHRAGRDAEALPHLIDVEQRQPDMCGIQIDLATVRGRTGTASALRPALTTLRGLIDPPRTGVDPCGRSERSRAALGAAELVLWSEPTGRAEARLLLDKAETLAAPSDVVFSDALTAARLRAGDAQKAETLSRGVLEIIPSRRGTRLLLARALLRRDQGSEALSALEPLTGSAEGGKTPASFDVEAQLLRAQGLLQLNDTLEAQKLGRKILAGSGIPGAVRTDAQLLLGQVYLRLGEPAAAKRALEPLLQKVGATATAEPNGTNSEQLLDVQVLWAQTLLAVRPPEQQEARALLEAVVGHAPQRVEARTLLGKLLREMSEWSQSEQQLTAATRIDEHYTPARRELATLLMQRGDFGKAHALFRELVKDEQDPELLLACARAERLDGAAEQALATLANVKRSRGELQTKYDEALLGEKARALLALDRPGEAETLLRGPATDLPALRHPTLPALFLRAMVSGIVGPGRAPAIQQARALLGRISAAWRSDPDMRLAEAELFIAEENKSAARVGLDALIASLQTVPPSSLGEERALRQSAEHLVAALPPAAPPTKPSKGRR